MRKVMIALVFALSLLGTVLSIWEAISPFTPHVFNGVTFEGDRVRRVFQAEMPPGVVISPGDKVLDRPHGDILRGYRHFFSTGIGDSLRVSTRNGIVTVYEHIGHYPLPDALGELLRHSTGGVMIVVAALLFFRRPGVMAFAFWIWAMSNLGGFDLDVALDSLPPPLVMIISLVSLPFWEYSGLALISFAVRFPTGRVPAGLRWLDVTAWAALAALCVMEVIEECLYFAGENSPLFISADLLLTELGMVGVVAIMLWKRSHSDSRERIIIAWASTAFATAAAARAIGLTVASLPYGIFADQHFSWRFLLALSNVCPLLAVYPILRYRLFDIRFVISRATLYTTLTLAAFGTLAAVNWLTEHFVTDRLAFVLQPIAAVAIGLGYFRVRHLAQQRISSLLFHDRYVAEERLEATIRGLAFVERPASVDEVLVIEPTRTLRLASAALFRLTTDRFERGPEIGWNDAGFAYFARDDSLARALQVEGPIVALRIIDWRPASLPPAPHEPAVALGVMRRGVLSAVVLYGRHVNGTEIEPEELAIIRRLGAAASLAYEAAEVATLRERNQLLESQLQRLGIESPHS